MNKRIGICASAVNLAAVLGFAAAMLLGTTFTSYLSSILIAFSFVVMVSAFAHYSDERSRTAAITAVAFGGMYALCNAVVYFIQLTTVRGGALGEQAAALLDFQRFGMIFNLDMLGYCLMSLSTLFAGFTVQVKSREDRWLKGLLIVHGVFALSCFIVPFLGLFKAASGEDGLAGTLVLEFWCVYFAPVGVLSALHFSKKAD
ncbi:MAG: hypothetical protein LLF87_01485 [Eubacteriales bacterium]|nr:hypothetical protein [Eubacteriales bacterium]